MILDDQPQEPKADDDAPRLMTRLLKWVSAALLVASMAGVGHLLLRWEPQYLPVRVVSIEGEVRRLPRERLQETLIGNIDGGILTLDLNALKDAVEALAWVHTASVRRDWPDRLTLSVVEHEPMARWGARGLVTAEGILFRPDEEELPRGLPRMTAEDDQAPAMVRLFRDWQPRFEALGVGIVSLKQDARGALSLGTDADFVLVLGKQSIAERVSRFLRAYPAVAAAGRPARVDMRYSNGLAVTWAPAGGSDDPGRTARVGRDPAGPRSGTGALALDQRSTGLHRPSSRGPGPFVRPGAPDRGPSRS